MAAPRKQQYRCQGGGYQPFLWNVYHLNDLLDLSKNTVSRERRLKMKNQLAQMMKIALAGFIEDLLQSENGPRENDIEYIIAERERIRQLELVQAA